MRRRNVGVFCCLLCLVLACSTMMFGCGKAKQEEQKSSTDQKTEKTDELEETGDDVAALLKNAKYVAATTTTPATTSPKTNDTSLPIAWLLLLGAGLCGCMAVTLVKKKIK